MDRSNKYGNCKFNVVVKRLGKSQTAPQTAHCTSWSSWQQKHCTSEFGCIVMKSTILTSFIAIKLLERISKLFATFHNFMQEVYPLVVEHSSGCRIWFNLPKKILGKPLYKMYVLSFCAFTKTQSWCWPRDGQLLENVNSILIKAAI